MSDVKAPPRRLAARYYCASRSSIPGNHTEGEGRPKRSKCGYCGGQFYTETGLYGVFHWKAGATVNDYSEAKALHLFASSKPADKIADDAYAADSDSDLVVRWIYVTE
jgi:hypothetical protein